MNTQTLDLLHALLALCLGTAIGLIFGALQQGALRRHAKRQAAGQTQSGWLLMPGASGRVAVFLVALATIQILYPSLFANQGKWWVSAGVVGGYGALLVQRLRHRLLGHKSAAEA